MFYPINTSIFVAMCLFCKQHVSNKLGQQQHKAEKNRLKVHPKRKTHKFTHKDKTDEDFFFKT